MSRPSSKVLRAAPHEVSPDLHDAIDDLRHCTAVHEMAARQMRQKDDAFARALIHSAQVLADKASRVCRLAAGVLQ